MPTDSTHNRFSVDPGVLALFPEMRLVVAIARDLDNGRAAPGVDETWIETWSRAGTLEVANPQSHPRVRAWREDFKAFGVSMKRFPISIEPMLRRALKGGEPFRINPLVDLHNTLSLRHVCPAGAFDLDALEADLQLRFTTEADRFTALDAGEPVQVDAGEVAYASGNTVLTRHFMWRQAREGLIGPSSHNLFFVSEIPGVAGEQVARQMENDIREGLANHFDLDCKTFVMDASLTSIEW